MFTGIIEEIGKITAVRKGARSSVLTIEGRVILGDLKLGDSVSVNGVCLTVSSLTGQGFTADVMSETLRRSDLGALQPGSGVNLERAMPADGRFGGHIVSGHIDGTGTITNIRRDDNAQWITIRAPRDITRLIVEKGSICIDGISLTVAGVREDEFDVSIIPHTAKMTTLAGKKTGDPVNLENDIIGKYVEKLLGHGTSVPADSANTVGESPNGSAKRGLTEAFLLENGF